MQYGTARDLPMGSCKQEGKIYRKDEIKKRQRKEDRRKKKGKNLVAWKLDLLLCLFYTITILFFFICCLSFLLGFCDLYLSFFLYGAGDMI